MKPNRLPAIVLFLATEAAVSSALAQGEASPGAVPPAPPAAPAPTETAPPRPRTPATEFEGRIASELGVRGGLTSRDVAERALATSYVLEARRADIARASAQVDRAFAAYLPRLELIARYTRLSYLPIPPIEVEGYVLEVAPPLNQTSLQARLIVPVSDYFLRVGKAHDATKLAAGAARKNAAATELSTAADAKLAYYAWVQARLSMLVAQSALESSNAHLSDVKHAFAAGSASQADVLGIEARVADGERLLAINRNLVSRLEEQLRILRHDPPGTSYRVGESLQGDPPLPSEQLSMLTEEALSHRPELESLALQVKATQARAAVERAGALPRLDLFANGAYDNPNSRVFPPQSRFRATWDAGVQASWVVSDIPGALAAGHGESAVAKSLLAERRALTDQIRNEVTLAYTALLDARASLATTGRSLAAAEEAHRVRRVLFQNGRATSVEVMDAELELTRARLDAVSARIDLAVAHVRLDYALGRKGSPTPPG